MSTKKEEFVQSVVDDARRNAPDVDVEAAEKLAVQVWTAREIMREVVLDDTFKTTAHRYYHGVGHARASLIMTLPLGQSLISVLVEHMFALGFACGVADARGWDVNEVASLEEAAECLEKQQEVLPALMTRDEIDQDDALPSILGAAEDALAEGFEGTLPPDTPPDMDGDIGSYFPE